MQRLFAEWRNRLLRQIERCVDGWHIRRTTITALARSQSRQSLDRNRWPAAGHIQFYPCARQLLLPQATDRARSTTLIPTVHVNHRIGVKLTQRALIYRLNITI